MYKLLALLLAVTVMAAACGSDDAAESAAPDGDEETGQVSGTLVFRERIAVEPGSTATVSLVDVSLADAPAVLIVEQEIEVGNGPLDFELDVPLGSIQQGQQYSVQASVQNSAGDLTWTTDTQYDVDLSADNTADVGTVVLVLAG